MFIAAVVNEFIKIAAKPRSYLGLATITVLVGVIELAMYLDGESYVRFVTSGLEQSFDLQGSLLNGHLMAFIVLQLLIIHVPLLVALVTADLISGEAATGTLRMLITRPLSRTALWMAKCIAGALYTLLILVWLGLCALGISMALFGSGDLVVLNSDGILILQQGDILWRFLNGFALAYLALLTVSTLSLTLSGFSSNSLGPMVVTMALIILFTLIGTLDVQVFDPIRPFLFTTHMAAWRSFFEDPLRTNDIAASAVILLVHILVLMGVGIWHFNRKDITI